MQTLQVSEEIMNACEWESALKLDEQIRFYTKQRRTRQKDHILTFRQYRTFILANEIVMSSIHLLLLKRNFLVHFATFKSFMAVFGPSILLLRLKELVPLLSVTKLLGVHER